MFRRSSKLQIDRIVQKHHNNQKSCDKFIAEWKESMQQVIDIANKNTGKAIHLNKTTDDRKLYDNDIDVGNWVLLRNISEWGGNDKLRSQGEDICIMRKKSRSHTCLQHQAREL